MKPLPEARPGAARYVTLDGMRGLAAIAVALFHFDIMLVPHGYLAVDFFFVLSGFVLSRSYLPRFREGLAIGAFMVQRFARLWPLFALGVMLGVVVEVRRILFGVPTAMPATDVAVSAALHMLLLPSPTGLPFYPLNVPAWSLFFEIVANVALFLLVFRLPRWALALICLLATAGMAPIILDHGSANIGALWSEYGIALLRTAFSFTLGAIIATLPAGHLRPSNWLGVACIVVIGVLLAMPVPREWLAAYDLTVILLLSPLLVYAGSRCEPVRFAVPLAAFTGELSYALYAVHWAFVMPVRSIVWRTGLEPLPAATLFLTLVLLTAWAAVRWYDLPLRRFLTALLRREARAARPLGV